MVVFYCMLLDKEFFIFITFFFLTSLFNQYRQIMGSFRPFLSKWVLNTFPFLIVWPAINSCKFLWLLNATNGLFWNISRNSAFTWTTFQYLLRILRIIVSFLLCDIKQGILFLLIFACIYIYIYIYTYIHYIWYIYINNKYNNIILM